VISWPSLNGASPGGDKAAHTVLANSPSRLARGRVHQLLITEGAKNAADIAAAIR